MGSKKKNLSRIMMLNNAVFYHGHLQGYFILILAFVSILTTWYLLLPIPILMLPNIIYYLEIIFGRTKKIEGKLIKKRQIYLFSVYNVKEDDNLCFLYEINMPNGKKKKLLAYNRTFRTTYDNKTKIKKHTVDYQCTYYYLPISRIIVDIDYKCQYK